MADEVHEVAASPSAVFSSYSDNFLVTGVEVQIIDGSGRHPFPVRHPILLDTDNIAMSTPNPEDEDSTVVFSLTDEGSEAGLLLRLVYQGACASVAWPMVGMEALKNDDELRKRYVKRSTSKTVQSGFIAETVHPFDNKTFDLSKETAVADMLRWAASLEEA